MLVKLLAEHYLEILSLKGGYTGSSESTLVKMPHCWKSRAAAQSCYLVSITLISFSSAGYGQRTTSPTARSLVGQQPSVL